MTEERAVERDPMSGAALRCVRERLGLTTRWLADHLEVAERSVHRWESGGWPVPDGVRLAVEQLQLEAGEAVVRVERLLDEMPDPVLVTYRTDADYAACDPDAGRPASWHRAVVGRVAERRPATAVVYREP